VEIDADEVAAKDRAEAVEQAIDLPSDGGRCTM
jgi:hypothetical protein